MGDRFARRFRGRGLVGRLFLGLRLGDGGLGRGLCRDPGLLGLGRCRSFFLSCDLIERVQFFLRRQLAALGHDREAEGRGHVGEELDRNFEAADPLDRLGEVELAPVDPDPLALPDPVGDVRRRDRAEERAGLAGLDVEAELGTLELLHELLRVLEALRLVLGAARGELLELRHAAPRRGLGEPSRQQVVAREARGDVDDLAAEAYLLDVLSQDDLHQRSRSRSPRSPRSRRPSGRSSRPSAT